MQTRHYFENATGGRYTPTLASIIVAMVCYPFTQDSTLAKLFLDAWAVCALGLLIAALRPKRISRLLAYYSEVAQYSYPLSVSQEHSSTGTREISTYCYCPAPQYSFFTVHG